MKRYAMKTAAFLLLVSTLAWAQDAGFKPVVVAEHGFENNTSHGWVTRGGMGSLSFSDTAHSGKSSIKISGRSVDWHCPRVEMTGFLDKGARYRIEVWVRSAGKDGAMKATVINRFPDKDAEEDICKETPVTAKEWTKLQGEFTFDPNAVSAFLYVFFKTNPTDDYLIDDVKVTKIADKPAAPVAAKIDSKTYDFEKGDLQGWTQRGTVTLSTVKEAAQSGSYGLKAAGRGENWSGPSLNLKDSLKMGAKYDISGYIRLEKAPAAPSTVKFTMEEKPVGKSTGWKTVAQVQIADTQWVKLAGAYTYASDMNELTLYAESSNVPDVLYMDNVVIAMTEAAPAVTVKIQSDIKSLKDATGLAFSMGAAIEPHQTAGVPGELLTKHFSVVVAGDVMKMNAMQPMEGTFEWANADKIINFAYANGMLVRFHTLEWHEQVPNWLFLDAGGKDMTMETDPAKKAANKKLLLKRLETHITTIVSRYKNKVWSWDVVNEVVDPSGPEGIYRDNAWFKVCGKDYIDTAFRAARAAGGPDARLYINDYETHVPAKRDALYKLVKELLARGVPIDGVGHQNHISVGSPSVALIGDSLRLFGSLGLDNQITEMDVSVYEDNSTAHTKVPEELIARQGWRYKALFDEFMRCKDIISCVVVWGLADNYTWLHNRPIPRRDAPLFFDEAYQAKPAYWAVVDPSKLAVLIQELSSAKGTPAVDGEQETAWKGAPWTPVRGGTGPDASFKTLWSENRLYVLADVKDASRDSADAVDVFVDLGNRSAAVNRNDVVRVSFTRGGGAPSGTAARIKEYDGGWILEASIDLPAGVAAGKKIGFDLRAQDAKTKGSVSWNDAGQNQNNDASKYGTLALREAARLAEAVPGKPAIDGNIESLWDAAKAITTDIAAQGSLGATAKVRTLWDRDFLYVLCEVTDPVLDKGSVNAYEQDSMEIFIDENNAKSDAYQADDGQFRVSFENAQSFGSNGADKRFSSAARRTDKGYVVEAAIPLRTLKGAEGLVIGFDAQVNDAEGGKRKNIAKWNDPTNDSYRNTSRFGCLIFSRN